MQHALPILSTLAGVAAALSRARVRDLLFLSFSWQHTD